MQSSDTGAVGVLLLATVCDEIGVRLTVIWHSDRAQYEPTVVV